MDDTLKRPLKELNDKELFDLLDATSDEVKRRNGLLGPSIIDLQNQPVEKTIGSVLEALADLGLRMKNTSIDTKGEESK